MADDEFRYGGHVQVGIVVRDLEAMGEFYGTLLGLEPLGDHAIPGGVMRRFVHGDAGVKLVRFETAQPGANPPHGMAGGAIGLRYLTIDVGDVAGTLKRCLAAGHAVPVPLMEFQPGMMIAIVEDPEGNWVELIE